MCSNFFTYYPRNKDFKACFSTFYASDLVDLIASLNKNGMADALVVPESAKNNLTTMAALAIEGASSLEKYASKMDEKTKDFIMSFVKSNMRYTSFCKAELETWPTEPIKASNVFLEPNVCQDSQTGSTTQSTPVKPSLWSKLVAWFKKIFSFLLGSA
ncbi:hypothetical protein DAPPUDRAFT_346078 [Daphnia pulex]|uniref:Uncharacterized protein n=1 Tax=Daphnia pulex TaxID=6669 RepID=E9I7Q5_DAPPU|nr:hypothetical protein DAPPUDRAFT_346078 [Daphnia pulex]|eukprot:EFX59975.1 hypothetical protein DAPPUDRAFT_346078 [Daphnia pulex]